MFRKLFWFVLLVFVLPIGFSGFWSYSGGWPSSFRTADWSATGIAPDPKKNREAIIQVYAARAGRWKGVFGVHTWIIMKPKGARRFERYDVVGWGKPVRRNNYAVDGRWYGNLPYVIRDIRGPLAERNIPKIRRAIRRYPANKYGDYHVWPGPNSNTFVSWVAREFPQLEIEMPATAVGKDFLGKGFQTGPTPSGTGVQFTWGGMAGAAIGLKEGLEFHVLGATVGIDPEELAIKLPAVGTLGFLAGRDKFDGPIR